MQIIIVILALVGYAMAIADVGPKCLEAICKVESNCKPLPCAVDTDGTGQLSCGYFQIKQAYWQDCNEYKSVGKGWKECAVDKSCAQQCLRNYVKRYGSTCGANTCERYANIHNNGPSGCTTPAKGNYLERLRQFLAEGKK